MSLEGIYSRGNVLRETELLARFPKGSAQLPSFVSLSGLFQWLYLLNIWSGLAGLGLVIFTAHLLGVKLDWDQLLIPILLYGSLYNFDRFELRPSVEDLVNDPLRFELARRFGRALMFCSGMGLGVAVMLLAHRSWSSLLIGVSAFPILILYSSIPIRVGGRRKRIKEIPLLKNVYVGVGFVWVMLVSVMNEYLTYDLMPSVLFYLSVRMIANTMAFDLTDREGDEKAEVLTLPVVLGEEKTVLILSLLNLLGGVLLIQLLSAVFGMSSGVLLFVGMTYLYTQCLIIWFRFKPEAWKFRMAFDAEMATLGLVVLL